MKRETPCLASVIERIEARAKANGYLEEDQQEDEFSSDLKEGPSSLGEDLGYDFKHDAQTERAVTLPSSQDSKLWRLKVKQGMERVLVMRLTNKLFQRLNEGQPLMVLQIFECANTSSVIYVEAYKLSHVEQLTRGISGI